MFIENSLQAAMRHILVIGEHDGLGRCGPVRAWGRIGKAGGGEGVIPKPGKGMLHQWQMIGVVADLRRSVFDHGLGQSVLDHSMVGLRRQ